MESLFYAIFYPGKNFLIAVIRNDIPALEGLALSNDIVKFCDKTQKVMSSTLNQLKPLGLEAGSAAELQKRIDILTQIKELVLKADLVIPAKQGDPPVFALPPGQQFVEIIDPVTENLLYYFHDGEMADFIMDDWKKSLARVIYNHPMVEQFQAEDLVTLHRFFPDYLEDESHVGVFKINRTLLSQIWKK